MRISRGLLVPIFSMAPSPSDIITFHQVDGVSYQYCCSPRMHPPYREHYIFFFRRLEDRDFHGRIRIRIPDYGSSAPCLSPGRKDAPVVITEPDCRSRMMIWSYLRSVWRTFISLNQLTQWGILFFSAFPAIGCILKTPVGLIDISYHPIAWFIHYYDSLARGSIIVFWLASLSQREGWTGPLSEMLSIYPSRQGRGTKEVVKDEQEKERVVKKRMAGGVGGQGR